MSDIFDLKLFHFFIEVKNSIISSETDNLKIYFLDLHKLALKEKGEVEKVVKELVAKNPTNADEIYEHYQDRHEMYSNKYIHLANNNMLVTAYSFFEHQLKEVERDVNDFVVNKRNQNPTIQQHWPYILKAKTKIYGYTGLNFTSLDITYDEIDNFRKIRNCVVHNGSNIMKNLGLPLNQQDDYQLISPIPGIRLEPNGDFFILDNELVGDFIDKCGEYLIGILKILSTMNDNDVK